MSFTWILRFLGGGFGIFLVEFFNDPADAFLANVGDGFVTRLEGFGIFITRFRQLNHDEFAAAAILFVQVENGVRGGAGTGEKIEDDCSFVAGELNYFLQDRFVFGILEPVAAQ